MKQSKIRKVIATFLAVLMLGTVLAGCGSSKKTPTDLVGVFLCI